MKKLTWQDRIRQWSDTDKRIYARLTPAERDEVNAFCRAVEHMTMNQIMEYTKKTQRDGRHPMLKHRKVEK